MPLRYRVAWAGDGAGLMPLVVPAAVPAGVGERLEMLAWPAAGGLPLYAARWVQAVLAAWSLHGPHRPRWLGRWRWRRLRSYLMDQLEAMGLPAAGLCLPEPAAAGQDTGAGPWDLSQDVAREAQGWAELLELLVRGRCLLGTEVVRAARATGLTPGETLMGMETLVAMGRARRVAAVELDGRGGATCRRCGSAEGIYPEMCGACGSPFCPRCSRCAGMGVARGCEPLYLIPGPLVPGGAGAPAVPLALPHALSAAQARAAERLTGAVRRGLSSLATGVGQPGASEDGSGAGPRGCLVWAVTGAGKTEVAFGAVQVALEMGGAVLFAAPRREVAVDIARRAWEAFGGEGFALLVGRCRPDSDRDGLAGGHAAATPATSLTPGCRLVVATTHQALRFYQAFSLVVLDEVDAFPYAGSDMLHLAVDRATHPKGYTVWMSATPDRRTRDRVRAGHWEVVTIAARHHGYPLPEPSVYAGRDVARWQQAPQDASRVPAPVRRWMEARRPATRLLVFCPTIRHVEAVAAALGAPACHSRHPRRQAVLDAFSTSRDGVLVASTLLERGLTFSGLDVLVAFADYEAIFDEAALVQMAGRAGRSVERPEGRVLFVAARRTAAMRQAVEHIRSMNRQARREGLLCGGGMV
ncbi:MAG: DEAD/DEAH box helicase [Limnochordaceae bacterium]|nr:DEAD/DEAH box helicase [Limnochordaceae bacterium]